MLKKTKNNVKKEIYQEIKKYKNIYIIELFGGTGKIAIDISKTKKRKALIIEKNKKHHKIICKNKKKIKSKNIKTKCKNSYNLIKKTKLINYNIIFLDPPYKKNIKKYLNKIENIKNIKKYLTIIYETNKILILKKNLQNFFIIKRKKNGNTIFYIIKKI